VILALPLRSNKPVSNRRFSGDISFSVSPEVGLMPILRTMPAAEHHLIPGTKTLIGLAGHLFRSIQLAAKGAAEFVSSARKFRNDNRNMHLQIASRLKYARGGS
jgi:hypothetical protein